MFVEVTQSHIDKGLKADYRFCPVARASSDALGCVCSATQASVLVVATGKIYSLPDFVTYRIKDYDAGYGMVPFGFFLPDF